MLKFYFNASPNLAKAPVIVDGKDRFTFKAEMDEDARRIIIPHIVMA